MANPTATADIGMIGLAVMGENLALNMADHGFKVAVFNRTTQVAKDFVARNPSTPGGLVLCQTMEELVAAIKKPRKVVILVKAGAAVDAVTRQLIESGIEADDIVVDCGNSLWTDTIRREKDFAGQCKFFGSGVSGGEVGARFGPSLMPGGDPDSWKHLEPIWRAVAAKVDEKTGKPIETYAPGKPVVGGVPCTAYIGPDGAGHYVKMVHNGIEYVDMQLICEAYFLMQNLLGLKNDEMSKIFAAWNQGDLDSFLIQITADILQQRDPVDPSRYLVDMVLDAAGQKGTGKWTSVNSLDMGIPANAIAEATFARCISALKEERMAAAEQLAGPKPIAVAAAEKQQLIDAVRDALYCSKICAYAQGFQLMREAQKEYHWKLDFGTIASIWRGGCIIRARFLQKITDAYRRDADLVNLLLDPYFNEQVKRTQGNWRRVVALAAQNGVAAPAFMSALAYYDGYRAPRLPANLLQAQRDYFGAHTYERVDRPRGTFFHLDWPDPKRPQIETKKRAGTLSDFSTIVSMRGVSVSRSGCHPMPYRAIVIGMLFATAAVAGAAVQGDRSTPIGALKSLAVSLDRGDEAGIAAVLYAEPGQPKQAKLRDGVAKLAHATARMRQAAVAAFGSENARELAGEPNALEQELADIDAATVKIETTSAGSVAHVQFAVKPALTLRLVEGKWVRPIADMRGWIDTETIDTRIARLQSRAEVFDAVADEIAAGKYKTAEAAAAGLKKKMTDAEIGESSSGDGKKSPS